VPNRVNPRRLAQSSSSRNQFFSRVTVIIIITHVTPVLRFSHIAALVSVFFIINISIAHAGPLCHNYHYLSLTYRPFAYVIHSGDLDDSQAMY